MRLLHAGHRACGWPRSKRPGAADAGRRAGDVEAALRAHLCRCTGWQSIVEAACSALGVDGAAATPAGEPSARPAPGRVAGPGRGAGLPDLGPRRRARRRRLRRRHGAPGRAGPARRRCAARRRPPRRAGAGAAGSRAATAPCRCRTRSRCPTGEWALTLQTTWVEPAYVEPDASWCRPGGTPASPLANGGAFGGKRRSPVPARARRAGRRDGRGRPGPVAARGRRAARAQAPTAGHRRCAPTAPGVVRVGRTPGSADLAPLVSRVRACCPGLEVEEVEVAGPPVAPDLRGAGWAEVLAARGRARRAAAGRRRARGGRDVARARAGPRQRRAATRRRRARPRRGRRVGRRDAVSRDAALLRARRRAPGARAGLERGHRGRRRRRAGRPDHPLLRHPGRARHARRRRPAPRGGRLAGQRLRRRVRRHAGGGLDRRGPARRAGRPGAPPCARRRATWHHRGGSRGAAHEPSRRSLLPRPPGRRLGHHLGPGRAGHRRRRARPALVAGRHASPSSARRCRTWPRCSPSRARRWPTSSRRRCTSSTWGTSPR